MKKGDMGLEDLQKLFSVPREGERELVYFDMEFTGLRKDTSLISIALVDARGNHLYAEVTDYKSIQVDSWLKENVIDNLFLESINDEKGKIIHGQPSISVTIDHRSGRMSTGTLMIGTTHQVGEITQKWLHDLHESTGLKLTMMGDCPAWDWVLLVDLLTSGTRTPGFLPQWMDYIPMDLCTSLVCNGINADVSREDFLTVMKASLKGSGWEPYTSGFELRKHNAIYDAMVIRDCWEALDILRRSC